MRARAKTPSRRTGFVAALGALLRADGRGTPSRRPALISVALMAISASLLAAFSSSALADTGHTYEKSFGPDGSEASQFLSPGAIGIDESTGDVYVAALAAGTVSKFDASGAPTDFSALSSNEIGGFSFFNSEEGCSQIAVNPVNHDFYVTNNATGAVMAYLQSGLPAEFTAGPGLGTNRIPGLGELCGVAVDSHGDIYASSFDNAAVTVFNPVGKELSSFAVARATNIAVGKGGEVYVVPFAGNPLGPVKAFVPSEYPPTRATTYTEGETVDPEPAHAIAADPVAGDLYIDQGNRVVQYDETGEKLGEFAASGPGAVAKSEGLAVNGDSGDVYISDLTGSQVKIFSGFEALRATTAAGSGISEEGATLNGAVEPNGTALTECKFDYGSTGEAVFSGEAPCVPSAADIPADSASHPVAAPITALQPNTTYRFRLVTRNARGETSEGRTLTFSTVGVPLITEVRSAFADQSSATLEAKVDPRTFATSYHFEWGPTGAYGNTVEEGSIAAGEGPSRVTAAISGLAPGTTYHYRVVAESGAGRRSVSPDETVETLDACGLPSGRCFELVSPPEVGLVGTPGHSETSGGSVTFQAASGPGSLAYIIDSGLPGSTSAGEVLYQAVRDPTGWSSAQLDPAISERSQLQNGSGTLKSTLGLSEDLSCEALVTPLLLTGDPGTRRVVEAGGANLYRRSRDGTYSAITSLPPTGTFSPSGQVGSEYELTGMSDECSKVVFSTQRHYPRITGIGTERLYEWESGRLRSVGVAPGPGEEDLEATAGPNAVSSDGSRVFFSAQWHGVRGVFVREDGSVTHDLSLSATPTPDTGATYQYATKDGERVYFTANAGLTSVSSATGTDLYEYDLGEKKLVDLSVDIGSAGAEVRGVIGTSADGSVVYFAAQGQLVPGKGKTLAENRADETYSVYGVSGGQAVYVGVVTSADLGGLLAADPARQTSSVSPDGNYLLFESSAVLTGYQSGDRPEAYLFDVSSPDSEATVCVSCRQDGSPSIAEKGDELLANAVGGPASLEAHGPRALVERGGKPRVYFYSRDRLAVGAIEGVANLYEWAHGQVSRLASAPTRPGNPERYLRFVGANADSTDVYLVTPEPLTWEDRDERQSVYDARIGGGFPQPPAPPASCDPNGEGSCQGAPGPVPGAPVVGSNSFVGPGNPKAPTKRKHHKKKHHKRYRKHHSAEDHKAKHHKKGSENDRRHTRHENTKRRAGK